MNSNIEYIRSIRAISTITGKLLLQNNNVYQRMQNGKCFKRELCRKPKASLLLYLKIINTILGKNKQKQNKTNKQKKKQYASCSK